MIALHYITAGLVSSLFRFLIITLEVELISTLPNKVLSGYQVTLNFRQFSANLPAVPRSLVPSTLTQPPSFSNVSDKGCALISHRPIINNAHYHVIGS